MTHNEEEIRAMKVVELKAELLKCDLPQTGKKDELIDRLLQHLSSSDTLTAASNNTVAVEPVAKSPVVNEPVAICDHPKIRSFEEDEAARRSTRAARFGIPVVEPSTSTVDKKMSDSATLLSEEAKQRRIERFGIVEPAAKKSQPNEGPSSNKIKKGSIFEGVSEQLEIDRLKARQARFGVTTSKSLSKTETEEAKLRRFERFSGNSSS